MQNININGKANIAGGEYGTVTIDGIGQCESALKADTIRLDGKFKCLGFLETRVLECDGMAECFADISAKRMAVDGYLTVKGGTKIEAEEIFCDGAISIDGQISADKLEADGFICAKEIVGDKVVIRSARNAFAKLIMRNSSKVDLIEATQVELYGVSAREVNGCDIMIGPHCQIERLDCSGTLFIDGAAKVETITGQYTRRDKK